MRRRLVWGTCLALLLMAGPAAPSDRLPSVDLVLVAGTVIDGSGYAPRHDCVILIAGDRILDIRPLAEAVRGRTVVDARSRTVIPGLINAHVHHHGPVTGRPIAEGVTTLFDLGNSLAELALVHDSANCCRPRVLVVGPIITATNSYLSAGPARVLAAEIDSAANARRLVDELAIVHRVDAVKFALCGLAARYGNGITNLSPAEAAAIVATAHGWGLRTFAHVESAADVALAIAAGVDVLAHVPGEELPPDLLTELVTRGIPIIPTLSRYRPGPWYRPRLDNVRRFFLAGGLVVLGDDAGGPDIGRPDREIELLRWCGLDAVAIIAAGTSHAARAAGIDGWLGTIAPGQVADLVVLDGDLSRDFTALRRVVMVIQSGRVIYARD